MIRLHFPEFLASICPIMSEQAVKNKRPILGWVGAGVALFALLLLPLIGVEKKAFFSDADSQETFGVFALIGGASEMWTPGERIWQVNVTAAVIFISSALAFFSGAAAWRLGAGVVGLAASCVLLLPAFFPGSFFVPYFVAGSYALMLGFILVILDGLIGVVSACPKGFWQFRLK